MNTRALLLPILFATSAFAGPVEDAKLFLQKQQYKEAVAVLSDAAISKAADASLAHYLRAVAFAESKQFPDALKECDLVGGEWRRKALFLKAQSLAHLKRHQEAEAIYSAESARLFTTARQEKLAESLASFSRELSEPGIAGQTVPADTRRRALALLQKALELETGTDLREQLMFDTAGMLRELADRPALEKACLDYLDAFDPDWESAKRKATQPGKHRWEIRALLIENTMLAGLNVRAVRLAESLIALWKMQPPPVGMRPDAGDIEWLICRSLGPDAVQQPVAQQVARARNEQTTNTFQQNGISNSINLQTGGVIITNNGRDVQSSGSGNQTGAGQNWATNQASPEKYATALRSFSSRFPNHPRAAEAAWTLAQALAAEQKLPEAIAACIAFGERADWPAPAPSADDARTPAERLAAWKQEALYKVGELRFSQRQYSQAIEQWREYITRHPDGGLWQKAQAAIVDAEFQLCLEAVALGQRAEVGKRFEAFSATHPLDARCAQLLFLTGQSHYVAAQTGDKPGTPRTKERLQAYELAIAEWAKLIVKYPQSAEASLALYKTASTQADIFGRYEEALATFQRITFGTWKTLAAERVKMMPQKSLAVRTPRVFRNNEAAHIRVDTSNIEHLRVSRYTLNLEDYFRSRHRLDGENGINSLNIELIQPNKTWEHAVPGFTRLKPIEQEVAVPFDDAKPGVCLVRVEGDDWQTSAVVIRSDIDVVVQSAWSEALVFVQNRVNHSVVAGAEVLVSDGKEIIGQGRTEADGVFRLRAEAVRAAADLCVYVRTPAGEAIQRVDLRGMTQEITGGDNDRESVTPTRTGLVYTNKETYSPGETVNFRAIIRDVENGQFSIPKIRDYEVSVQNEQKRIMQREKLTLGDFGALAGSIPLPRLMPYGAYRIVVRTAGGDESYRGDFQVLEYATEEFPIAFELSPRAVFSGDPITAVVTVRQSHGSPLANEPLSIQMPDGRQLQGKTDAEGKFTFKQETSEFRSGQWIEFTATLPDRGARDAARQTVRILDSDISLTWQRIPAPALVGEATKLRVKALSVAGLPVATKVKLTLMRGDTAQANPVLSGLPNLQYFPNVAKSAVVKEWNLETEPTTGFAETDVTMTEAGPYSLQAEVIDSRGKTVTISSSLVVSGADDATRLRLFAEAGEVPEQSALKLDAHSRVAAQFALVTFAGESILEHRVQPIAEGHNEIALNITAAHWPHVEVAVALLHGEKTHIARRGFVVARSLKLELEFPRTPQKPGSEIELVVTARDAQGNPVAAELSVAMTSVDFLSQYPVERQPLATYFAKNTRHLGSVRTASSVPFEYRGESRVLARDANGKVTTIGQATLSNIEREQTLRIAEMTCAVNPFMNVQTGPPPLIAQQTHVFDGLREIDARATGSPVDEITASEVFWAAAVATDATGRATVKVRVPQSARAWKITTFATGDNGNFGEATAILTSDLARNKSLPAPAFVRPTDAPAEKNVTRLLSDDVETRTFAFVLKGTREVEIPAHDRTRMHLSLHESPLALLAEMASATNEPADKLARTPQTAASELLNVVSALRAIKAAGNENAALSERARRLIATLQITQSSGGWSWQDVDWERDSIVSSTGLWALVEARAQGFLVEDTAITEATAYLKTALPVIPPDEPEKTAVILHALSLVNSADFSVMNRLVRERARLNDPALAYLAAAFQRLDRPQDADELLKALDARKSWTGAERTARLNSASDTTAIVLYAASRANAKSPLAARAAESLLARLGVAYGGDSALRGLWTAALSEHFIGSGQHRAEVPKGIAAQVNGGAIKDLHAFSSGDGNGATAVKLTFEGNSVPILLATSIVARGNAPKPIDGLPTVTSRKWLHEGMRHRDRFLKAHSTSPVGIAALGQRIRVQLVVKTQSRQQDSYVIVDEPIPAGCVVADGSLTAPDVRVEELPGKLRIWLKPGTIAADQSIELSYELIALHQGTFEIPATIVSDACRPERWSRGPSGQLSILPPAAINPELYQTNRDELLELAKLHFAAGELESARPLLTTLSADPAAMKASEREISHMLLWAHTARTPMASKQVVELFEALSERHPDIVIPFDRILKVAEAYRQIGEFERACLVHSATMESAFVRDAGVSAALESNGDFLGGAEHKLALWREYPDAPDISLAYFQLAQSLVDKAPNAASVPVRMGAQKLTKAQLLERGRDLLQAFVTLRARDELADDAAFSLANVYFELKDYDSVVRTASAAAATYPKSPFANSFHYVTALGYFWQYQFPQALAAAAPVAAGTSSDGPNARYITAQIFHAQEKYAEALTWYEKVKGDFNDAEESLRALREKGVRLPTATSVKPGEKARVDLGFRNVKEAALKIFRVDLMKLHERENALSEIGRVNLAGITPEAEFAVPLGNGLDYGWKTRAVDLPIKAEGAYLVIVRGDSQTTSGLVLITSLSPEVNEERESGSVRVQIRDLSRGSFVADADIAIYDSATNSAVEKGRTDPRGAFSVSGVDGLATVVVKLGDARYAYYRSPSILRGNHLKPKAANQPDASAPKPQNKTDYLFNVKEQMKANNEGNLRLWEGKMKSGGQGVQAEKAFKK